MPTSARAPADELARAPAEGAPAEGARAGRVRPPPDEFARMLVLTL